MSATIQNNICKVMEQLCDEEIQHKTVYTLQYEYPSDEKKENLTYNEEKQFISDEEIQWVQNMRRRKGMHISSCSDSNCQRIRKIWLDENSLKKYVQKDDGICPNCNSNQFGFQKIQRGDPTLTADTFELWICRNCNHQPYTNIPGLI